MTKEGGDWIWRDGEWLPWEQAQCHLMSYSLHYGIGAFEGIRSYATDQGTTVILGLSEHINRFFNSAKLLRMPLSYDREQIMEICQQVVRRNNAADSYIRPLIYYGHKTLSLRAKDLPVHVAVAAWPWTHYFGETREVGLSIGTSAYHRNDLCANYNQAKAIGNYMVSSLALQDAFAKGYQDALLLDPNNFVAEGSAANVFMVKDGQVFTPYANFALAGITRKFVLQLAQDLGYSAREKNITREEIYLADEVFFTGTAAEITPITSVDHYQIGHGKRGPITQALQNLFEDIVRGRRSDYGHWLTQI